MNFIENPDIFFKKIKNIQELFAYFEIIDCLAVNDRKFTEISFDSFVTKRFNEHNLTELRVKIFTFLLLNSEGYFGEILADQYSKLFSKFSEKFLIVLAKEPEWKRIVYSLDAGDWETFKTAVEKLGDSGFEGEFKRFVLAPLDKEGKRIIK